MNSRKNQVAVITGAGSGFGREFALLGARLGMRLMLADIENTALEKVVAEAKTAGAEKVIGQKTDVADYPSVEALAKLTQEQLGVPHLVFNNAGVGCGGLLWEHPLADWEWVLGVNLWGVIHGIKAFTPMMLNAATSQANYRGVLINTASMAGLLTPPNMGVYNVSKHAVVAITETLYQDLHLVSDQVSCAVLCPYFVPTAINQSERNRPAALHHQQELTAAQKIAQAMSSKAVNSGKVSAADVAQMVFTALERKEFYIFSHPHALGNVETRMQAIIQQHNPPDPFAARPDIGEKLRQELRTPSKK